MATGGSEFMSDEIKSIKCCLCVQENKTTDADKYCLDCKDYYCTSCVGIHQKIGIMKGHTIQDKAANNSTGSDSSLPSYPTQRCLQHPLEVISMYCKDHDEVTCAACMVLSTLHRSCVNILTIPENIDNLYKPYNLKDIQQKLCETKETMKEIKTSKENKIQELNKALKTEIQAVKAFRQELEALLDKMEQETLHNLRREFSRVEASVTEEIDNTESLLSSLNETASQLKKAEGNKAQEFVSVNTSQKLTDKGEEIQRFHIMNTKEKVFFTSDHSIKTFLEKFKDLGKVHCTPKNSLYKVKQQKDIKVGLDNDSINCHIHGSCITEDRYLLLADWNNCKLKRMDLSTEKIIDDIKLQDHPRGVCIVSKREAAVALNNKSVQFVSLGDKMVATRALTMNHTCFGLAHNNGKLFTYDHSNNMYVYDTNGQQQHKLTVDHLSSNFSPNQYEHYAVCVIGNKVFIAHHNKGLFVLDSQANHLSTHSYNNKSGYRGVCTDGRNVFASATSTNKIVQIGPDFKMLGELGNVKNITSLCFDQKNMRLIATVHASDNITILELE